MFFVVYIAEAHSVDGWQTESNEKEGVLIRQHTTLEERCAAASRCAEELGLSIPVLVDAMDDGACGAFSSWPERIYVLDGDGTIAYQGGHGPYDFRVDEAEEALAALVSD